MEQFGYREPKLARWRYAGEAPVDVVDLTEQSAVPPLSDMLANVLAGRGTGLAINPSAYDEDDDFDASLTDKLDLEAQRQDLAERVRAQRAQAKPSQDADKPQGDDLGAHGEPSEDKPAEKHISSADRRDGEA